MYAPEKYEIPAPIFKVTWLDKPGELQSGKTGRTVENRGCSYTMKMERKTMVQASSDFTGGDSTVAGRAVVKCTVRSPKEATVSDDTVLKIV